MKLLVAVALLCAGFLAGQWLATERQSERLAELRAENKRLAAESKRVDTLYAQKVVTQVQTRTRTDSILVATTDSFFHVDTVRVMVEAERASCDAVIATCEERVAVRDQRITTLEEAVKEAAKRPRLSKNLYVATDGSGGWYGGAEARLRSLGLEGFARYEVRVDSLATNLRAGLLLRF